MPVPPQIVSWSSLDWTASEYKEEWHFDSILGTAFDIIVHCSMAFFLGQYLSTVQILLSVFLVQCSYWLFSAGRGSPGAPRGRPLSGFRRGSAPWLRKSVGWDWARRVNARLSVSNVVTHRYDVLRLNLYDGKGDFKIITSEFFHKNLLCKEGWI